MSTTTINGTLILDGNLTCDGDIEVTYAGEIYPDMGALSEDSYYSCESESYIKTNGTTRVIKSTNGDITINGGINGEGRGFGVNQGPGANSTLESNLGQIKGYGATHAGLGAGVAKPGEILPNPLPCYGSYKAPVSVGSGSYGTYGGSAVKIEALAGLITIDGAINVNGGSGAVGVDTGGGAGGSVWIYGWRVDGSGIISADGGSTSYLYGGGGGGGYISVWYLNSNSSSLTFSVKGKNGGQDGKTYFEQLNSVIEEKFTGDILNTKWWEIKEQRVNIDNSLKLDATTGVQTSPEVLSNFNIEGQKITVDASYIPRNVEPDFYNADFVLFADDHNWAGIGRRPERLFAIYCIDGYVSQMSTSESYKDLTFRIAKNDSTFDFQYYDSTSTPITIYSAVLPKLDERTFRVQFKLTRDLSRKGRIMEQLKLTQQNIDNQYVSLAGFPSTLDDATSVTLSVIEGSYQIYGKDFYIDGAKLRWDTTAITPSLTDLFETGDVIRVQYEAEDRLDPIAADFDNFRAWDGIVTNAETDDPILYVDSVYGSDSSSGQQLHPLKNLFVATRWAKRGGIVVLYDGTHNSTDIRNKNLTLRGANGVKPTITSIYNQDTTGSGWEDNAVSFYNCQGMIKNLTLADSTVGVHINESPYFEVRECAFSNTVKAIESVNSDPIIMRNEIYDSSIGASLSESPDSSVYSNIIYDCSTAVSFNDSLNVNVTFNTIDDCDKAVIYDNSSSGIVASNNLTNLNTGLIISSDSSPVFSRGNNYFGTATDIVGTVDSTTNDFDADPLYIDQTSRNYVLNQGSPDIGTGLSVYDDLFIDFRGASRAYGEPSEVGAFEYIDGSHYDTDYYVAGRGNDYYEFGNIMDPFRTLDKANSVADSTIHIDGGHYDSTYWALCGEPMYLNPFTVLTVDSSHFVSYYRLTELDIENGYAKLPGFIIDQDSDFNVAINPLDKPVAGEPLTAGPAQKYGTDFVIEFGAIRWAGLGLDGLLENGDILRILFSGNFHRDVIDTVRISSHFSNLDFGRAIYVSSNGSDSTTLGGDGTNSGGDGSYDRPYRTVQKALSVSSDQDNIVLISGEYPIFDGTANRAIVPAFDKASVIDKYPRMYYDDFFVPRDFRAYNHVNYDHNWNSTYSGDSSVTIGAGYLGLVYDGSNEARSESAFNFIGDYETSTILRQGVDPLIFSTYSSDSTAALWLNNGDYTASITINGDTKSCWGHLNTQLSEKDDFFTEYLCLTADNTRNGYTSMSMMAYDNTASALNIVGGPSQSYGDDFIINGEKIIWSGLGLDGEVVPGDILRIIYRPVSLSGPIKTKISLDDNIISIKGYDYTSWHILNKRVLAPNFDSTWAIAASMNEYTEEGQGRGFISRLLVVADDINGTDKARDYKIRTQRRPIVLYEERDIAL